MSTYNGRRAPNVSQYIANLNTVPSAADLAAQQEFGNFDDDLTLFTNTQFFDFDVNEPVGDIPFTDAQQPSPGAMASDMNKPMNFGPHNNYQFPDFSFPQSRAATLPRSPPNGLALPPTPPNGLNFPGQQPQMAQQQSAYPSPQTGEKRKSTAASIGTPDDLDDHSRDAAEEDKRRRNTAASARFRVKKKQREQALEKTAKEMTDKVQILEARVGQLEMENKWLKGLITEKNLKAPSSASSDKSEVKDADRITESSKKGVGTEAKADNAVEV